MIIPGDIPRPDIALAAADAWPRPCATCQTPLVDAEHAADHATVHTGPQLVHSGIYALFMTPEGGRHLMYQPDGAPEAIHVPDIPAAALGLVDNFLSYGLPPAIAAMLEGKMSPTKVLGLARQAAAVMAANGDAPEGGGGDAGG